jgi:hypothetical protein
MANYSIQIISQSARRFGKASAFLLEDGIQIAKVTRAGLQGGYISDTKFKFFAGSAETRFQTFCESLSMSECVEALGFPV